MIYFVLSCLALVLLAGLASALALVASSPPKVKEVRDVFGFSSLKSTTSNPELPPLRRYPARDGEELAYRIYDSSATVADDRDRGGAGVWRVLHLGVPPGAIGPRRVHAARPVAPR